MLESVINRIKEIYSNNNMALVGIDGGGGSGKSTLANNIALYLNNTQIIHMDDFYRPLVFRDIPNLSEAPVGYEFDIDRLVSQVIEPYLLKENAKYQKYDWQNDCLLEWEDIFLTGIIIIEGCYSNITQLNHFYDIKIFVDCDRNIRLKRGLERDGKAALPLWINWMNGEDKYFMEQNPKAKADFIFVSDN